MNDPSYRTLVGSGLAAKDSSLSLFVLVSKQAAGIGAKRWTLEQLSLCPLLPPIF